MLYLSNAIMVLMQIHIEGVHYIMGDFMKSRKLFGNLHTLFTDYIIYYIFV